MRLEGAIILLRFILLVAIAVIGCNAAPDSDTAKTNVGQSQDDSDDHSAIAVPIGFSHEIMGGANGIASYAGNKIYFAKLPEKPVGPIWKNSDSNPPMPAANAIRLAIEQRKKLVEEPHKYQWNLVSATLIPWEDDTGYWYWEIYFELNLRFGGGSGMPSHYYSIVLMDGTVIVPKISEKPE